MSHYVRSRVLQLTLLASCMAAGAPAHADLEREMNDMFGSISNVTNPQAHIGARRGVISGGGVYIRNPITTVRPLTAAMPRIDAGCGGIDMYGGSFSFINADQFIQLARSIAANASGYAFDVALQALSPTLYGTIKNLQGVIERFNNIALDSCNLAQQAVDKTGFTAAAEAYAERVKKRDAAGEATTSGQSMTATDSVQAFVLQTNSPTTQLTATGYADLYKKGGFGNVTWRVLNETPRGPDPTQSLVSWFPGQDTAFLNALLSYVGTVTIVAPAPAGDTTSDAAMADVTAAFSESQITIKDLYYGNANVRGDSQRPLTLYNCPAYDASDITGNPKGVCMGEQVAPAVNPIPTDSATVLMGIQTRIERLLLGDGSTTKGLVAKLAFDRGEELEAEEKAFMEFYPTLAVELRNIAVGNPGAANEFARLAIGPFSVDVTQDLHDNLMTAMRTAASGNNRITGVDTLLKSLDKRDQEARAFFEELRGKTTTRANIAAMAAAYKANSVRPENFNRAPAPPIAGGAGSGTTATTP